MCWEVCRSSTRQLLLWLLVCLQVVSWNQFCFFKYNFCSVKETWHTCVSCSVAVRSLEPISMIVSSNIACTSILKGLFHARSKLRRADFQSATKYCQSKHFILVAYILHMQARSVSMLCVAINTLMFSRNNQNHNNNQPASLLCLKRCQKFDWSSLCEGCQVVVTIRWQISLILLCDSPQKSANPDLIMKCNFKARQSRPWSSGTIVGAILLSFFYGARLSWYT